MIDICSVIITKKVKCCIAFIKIIWYHSEVKLKHEVLYFCM